MIRKPIKKIKKPPYELNPEIHRRFDQRQNIFGRMVNDADASFYKISMYRHVPDIIKKKKSGYTHFDFSGALAAWTVYDYFHGAYSWNKLENALSVMEKPELPAIKSPDPAKLSRELKKIALRYGAYNVGICKINRQWLYSLDFEGNKIEILPNFSFAIVIAIAMDPKEIKKSPKYDAAIETGIAYSRMAFCVSCLAEFIRLLGFKAIPMGNDTALSIPLAIDAGMGELGRLGLLVTPRLGPCVRLCKVFTDMPLIPDKPINFGLGDFCRGCRRCVQACSANAIDDRKDPTFGIACPSNNPGIKRWPVNHDQCYHFWIENGSECSNCIAACPFTPRSLSPL